jgi:hypothetical protein
MSRLSGGNGAKKKTNAKHRRKGKQTKKVTTHQKASAMDSNSPAQRFVSARDVDGLIAKVVSEDDSRRARPGQGSPGVTVFTRPGFHRGDER